MITVLAGTTVAVSGRYYRVVCDVRVRVVRQVGWCVVGVRRNVLGWLTLPTAWELGNYARWRCLALERRLPFRRHRAVGFTFIESIPPRFWEVPPHPVLVAPSACVSEARLAAYRTSGIYSSYDFALRIKALHHGEMSRITTILQ